MVKAVSPEQRARRNEISRAYHARQKAKGFSVEQVELKRVRQNGYKRAYVARQEAKGLGAELRGKDAARKRAWRAMQKAAKGAAKGPAKECVCVCACVHESVYEHVRVCAGGKRAGVCADN